MDASFKYDPATNLISAVLVEPDKNTDGTPITNLAFVDVFYMWNGSPLNALHLQALSPNGGQTDPWVVSSPVPDGQVVDLDIWATATNSDGKTSDQSEHVTLHIDRSQAPKIPMPPTFQ